MARKDNGRQSRRSREEWARLIAEQAESGLSQRAFCEAQALSVSTFSYAKRRAGAAPGGRVAGAGGDFMPVVIETDVAQSAMARWDIELALGSGVVLRIRSA